MTCGLNIHSSIYIYIDRWIDREEEGYIYIYINVGPWRYSCFFLIYLIHYYIRVCFQLVAFVNEHIWYKALLMGYHIRLELKKVCSFNDFRLVMRLYSDDLFSLVRVYLSLLYPSLIFDMFLSLRVCVFTLEWFRISITVIFPLCVHECVCLGDLCVCMCGSVV